VFNLFENVVELTINQRQNDLAQQPFRDMLMSLRTGQHRSIDVYNLLHDRMIGFARDTEEFSQAVHLHHNNHDVETTNIEKLNSLVANDGQRMCRINAVTNVFKKLYVFLHILKQCSPLGSQLCCRCSNAF
jgi:hypothetical protein